MNNTDPTVDCLDERYWSYFLASSLITFFSGLILILSFRLASHFCTCNGGPKRGPEGAPMVRPGDTEASASDIVKVDMMTRLKWHCEELISGQTLVGRIMVSLSCALSTGSLIIYLIDASQPDTQEETCKNWNDTPSQQVDLAFNLFFMAFFIIRFIASNDKLACWMDIHAFVDYFTIPPIFVGIYLNRQWLGLRFLRALRLMAFPDILQYLSLLRTSNAIRLAQICTIFLSVWLAAAGFVHLVEISGDPWNGFENSQNLTYWECVYFIVVTMSTVGYGDIYCITTIGRGFIVCFVLVALAMFASFIPEAMEILGRRQKYNGHYDKPLGIRHIVVCGHVSYESVQNFLRDFLHEDRENQNIKCLFLDSKRPDLELEALFKRNFTQVVYFKGTAMSTRDLERVRLPEADACLILTNPRSRDPDAEDAANIMRVISVKNFHQDIRVIVQLMRYHNKAFCVNLPSWTTHDQVICLAEMKLGFMAQGCLAPGFSTLMANLFVMRSYKKSSKCLQWQDQYLRGAGMEVYTEHFSPALIGKTFPKAAEICFTKLKILLVALTFKKDGRDFNYVVLNPGNDVILGEEVRGFFVCQSDDEAKRALHFCKVCHGDLSDPSLIKACNCPPNYKRHGRKAENGQVVLDLDDEEEGGFKASKDNEVKVSFNEEIKANEPALAGVVNNKSSRLSDNGDSGNSSASEQHSSPHSRGLSGVDKSSDDVLDSLAEESDDFCPQMEQFDSTGLFHWVKDRAYDDVLLTHDKNRDVMKRLRQHVVLCAFGEENTPLIGLCNFIMPLRASSFRHDELKTIVIIGNGAFLRREWENVQNFPDVYIKEGFPLNRADLRKVKVNQSHMCVILTTNENITDDPTLVDKEAILCSLNIKTMNFQALTDIWKSSPKRTLLTLSLLRGGGSGGLVHRPMSGASVPMLTELANDYNAQFLDQDDEDDPDIPLYMTQPFACGRAFAASVLDTLMSTTYFNSEALNLIRVLITGGATPELEQILAEGLGFVRGTQSNSEVFDTRNRCRVTLLSLEDDLLQEFSNGCYGNLFVGALRHFGILCIGLYRQLDPRPSAGSYNRFIITNPPPEYNLYPSDKVYCLQPFVSRNGNPSAESDTRL